MEKGLELKLSPSMGKEDKEILDLILNIENIGKIPKISMGVAETDVPYLVTQDGRYIYGHDKIKLFIAQTSYAN